MVEPPSELDWINQHRHHNFRIEELSDSILAVVCTDCEENGIDCISMSNLPTAKADARSVIDRHSRSWNRRYFVHSSVASAVALISFYTFVGVLWLVGVFH